MSNIEKIQKLVKIFFPFAKKRLGFKNNPKVIFKTDQDNAKDLLGKTAYYNPEASQITLYINNRHPIDVCRSLSHELVHHMQNCNGDFVDNLPSSDDYAQEDEKLREIERQAYEQGNLIFRDFQDFQRKSKGAMMESNTKKIEREIADVKRSRGDGSVREVQDDISSAINNRNKKVNDELMRRWGFKK